MQKIEYYIIESIYDKKVGVAAFAENDNHIATAMPFPGGREAAEAAAAVLNEKQIPISSFCDAFAEGRLSELLRI